VLLRERYSVILIILLNEEYQFFVVDDDDDDDDDANSRVEKGHQERPGAPGTLLAENFLDTNLRAWDFTSGRLMGGISFLGG